MLSHRLFACIMLLSGLTWVIIMLCHVKLLLFLSERVKWVQFFSDSFFVGINPSGFLLFCRKCYAGKSLGQFKWKSRALERKPIYFLLKEKVFLWISFSNFEYIFCFFFRLSKWYCHHNLKLIFWLLVSPFFERTGMWNERKEKNFSICFFVLAALSQHFSVT